MIRQCCLRKFGKNLQNLKHYSSSSNGRFVGKNVVITASTQGIGLATARKFAQEGAKVIICSRKQSNVDNALETLNNEGLNVKGLVCHVGKEEDRNKLLHKASTLGGIDVLVQNREANRILGPMTQNIYGEIKTALLNLTKTMANEFAQYNIRVNCVAPGFVKTKFGKMLLQDGRLSTVSLNRFEERDDIASVIAFLASNDANYITGETVTITGGHISRI